jgi:isopenicillin-N epimerase
MQRPPVVRLPAPSAHAQHWDLDPNTCFLNHGSFGACPRSVLALQSEWRSRIERQPVAFFQRQIESELDAVRAVLGPFVGAAPDDLALVRNATQGVNTVLQRVPLEPGDELIVSNQEYNASANAAAYAAERAGARLVRVEIPFPLGSSADVCAPVLAAVTARTKLVLIDHITSQTGLVFPIETLVRRLRERGVETLVDGAHGPGQVPLELERWGVAYYTGNAHKWLYTPKGAALLYVRRDLQPGLRPLSISHGANSTRRDRTRFRLEFDWPGTDDPTPWLCIPAAIAFLSGLERGGLAGLQARNHALALEARGLLLAALGIPQPAPDNMLASLVSLPLPALRSNEQALPPLFIDPLQEWLASQAIEVPVMRGPWRLLRIAVAAYNSLEQYRYLAEALTRWRQQQAPA